MSSVSTSHSSILPVSSSTALSESSPLGTASTTPLNVIHIATIISESVSQQVLEFVTNVTVPIVVDTVNATVTNTTVINAAFAVGDSSLRKRAGARYLGPSGQLYTDQNMQINFQLSTDGVLSSVQGIVGVNVTESTYLYSGTSYQSDITSNWVADAAAGLVFQNAAFVDGFATYCIQDERLYIDTSDSTSCLAAQPSAATSK